MARVASFVVLDVFVAIAGYGGSMMKQNAAETRLKIASDYQLSEPQVEFYDGCLGALGKSRLTRGGAKEPICGCVAKRAIKNYNNVQDRVRLLTIMVETMENPGAAYSGPPISNDDLHTMADVMKVAMSCAATPTQGASPDRNASLDAYCAKAPDPAACRRNVE